MYHFLQGPCSTRVWGAERAHNGWRDDGGVDGFWGMMSPRGMVKVGLIFKVYHGFLSIAVHDCLVACTPDSGFSP